MRRKITKNTVKHANKVLALYKKQNKVEQNSKNNEINKVGDYEDLLDKRHFESWAQPDELDHHNHSI